MPEHLERLLEEARRIQMSEDQRREQRISFAYGNTHIENSNITRQMVADADDKISREERSSAGR